MAARRRNLPATAIVLGLLIAIGLCGFSGFELAIDGLAGTGCTGSGCAAKLATRNAFYIRVFYGGAIGGAALVVSGILAIVVRRRRDRRHSAAAEHA